jgi:hypothetical protein
MKNQTILLIVIVALALCALLIGWYAVHKYTIRPALVPTVIAAAPCPVPPEPPVIAAPIHATVRASWDKGFLKGLECATEYLKTKQPFEVCRERKWDEFKTEMGTAEKR